MKKTDEQTQELIDVEPTLEQLIECVERELGYRHRVYARRVERGKMTQSKANWEVKLMESVLKNLVGQRPKP